MKKQKKHFYHSIIDIESVFIELDKHPLTEFEKKELKHLAEGTLHHSILDLILSELNDKDKHLFLQHHASEKHEEIWSLLNEKVDNVEKKIKTIAEQVSSRLHKDLKDVHRG